jgi:dihydrofolate reductase
VSVVRQLLDAGLLDELPLFVHPATAGSGLKLFEESGPARHFELISAQPFSTGVVYLVYAPDPNPPSGGYDEAKQSLRQD